MFSHHYFSTLLLSVILGLLLFNAIVMQDTNSRMINGSSISGEGIKEAKNNDPLCIVNNQSPGDRYSNHSNPSLKISLCYPSLSNSNWIKNNNTPTNWTDINNKFEGWIGFNTNDNVTAFYINSSSTIYDTSIPPKAGIYINNFKLVDPPLDSLRSYVETTIWGMKGRPDYTDIGANVTDTPINPTYNIFYKYRNYITNTDYKVIDAIFVIQNEIYEILYQATEPEYSIYLSVYENILKSVKSNMSKDNEPLPGLKVAIHDLFGMSINPNNDTLYITNHNSGTISAIDTKTHTIINNITVGKQPYRVAMLPSEDLVYVTGINKEDGKGGVFIIGENDFIPFGNDSASHIAVEDSPLTKLLFVVHHVLHGNSSTISVINEYSERREVLADIPIGSYVEGIDINSITKRLYTANKNSTVSVIDYNTAFPDNVLKLDYDISNIHLKGTIPSDVAVDDFSNLVYVSDWNSNNIHVIDGTNNTIIENITVPSTNKITSLVVNHNTHDIFATNGIDAVYIIDGNTNQPKIISNMTGINNKYLDIVVNPKNNIAYAAASSSDTVHIINGTSSNLVVGINLKINPPNTGTIQCRDSLADANVSNYAHVLYDFNSTLNCEAIPKTDFAFSNWNGSLVSTEVANTKSATFTLDKLDKFGTIIANFEEIDQLNRLLDITNKLNTSLQSIWPKWNEFLFWILTGMILGPIAGWLINRYLDTLDRKKELRHLRVLMDMIDDIYQKNNSNKEECFKFLKHKHTETIALLKGGVIQESTYRLLIERINDHIKSLKSV